MTKARNIADLLDANGDVKTASLDNVPASNDASALTTGTLPNARLPNNISDGGTEGTKIATGTTAQRGSTVGQIRFNTTTGLAEYFDGTAYKSLDSAPTISSVSPTEVDRLAGGNQTVVITGSGFNSGATVTFVGNAGTDFNATTTTVDSSTQITAVAPKTSFLNAQEPYGVKVENSSGLSGILVSQINVDTDVSWTTSAGSLGSVQDASTGTHFTVVATDTDGDTITYSITAGSLPGGLSLNTATGAISGNPDDVTGDTTSTFTLRASTTNSTADREFSITVTTSPYSADFLVIAGGGGGGTGQFGDQGGGGGAGGYRNSYNSETSGGNSSSESSLTFNPGTVYTVTVGSGGGSSSQGNSSSLSGSDISTISSVGGGRGATNNGSQQGQNGGNGGSGGGSASADITVSGGSATSGQGSNGGGRSGWNNHSSAGGGGAGQTGGTASGGTGGNGGNGLSSSISGSSVTRGGGGGGTNNGGPGRSGGSGGGGTGRNGSNGTANTGGGGGGARSGGSGVVILRVPTVSYSSTTTGSPSVSTSGSDTIMVFNSSGSYTG